MLEPNGQNPVQEILQPEIPVANDSEIQLAIPHKKLKQTKKSKKPKKIPIAVEVINDTDDEVEVEVDQGSHIRFANLGHAETEKSSDEQTDMFDINQEWNEPVDSDSKLNKRKFDCYTSTADILKSR